MKVHKSTAVRAWEFVIPLLHTVVTPSINLNQGTPIEFMNTTFRYVVDGFGQCQKKATQLHLTDIHNLTFEEKIPDIVVENAIAEFKNWKLMKNEYQMNPFNLDKELKILNYILSIVWISKHVH